MNTDSPLTDIEDDKLGRADFAIQLAHGLTNSFKDIHNSVVLGINGEWGTGKSTLVNFILDEIERISKKQKSEHIIIKFNPWVFSGQKELQNIFLKELYINFKKKESLFKEAGKAIGDLIEYFSWLKYIHSGAGEAVKDTKQVLDKLTSDKDLYGLKEDISKLLVTNKIKLYIAIDDIDRLTPTEINEIFQLVKLNANFSNTIFILAYDREVVNGALHQLFGENSSKYLEKIVQIDYTLPRISKDEVKSIFLDTITEQFKGQNYENAIIKAAENLIKNRFIGLFSSIRDIVRYSNSLLLRLPSIASEINISDYMVVEALRVFAYDVYNKISISKDDLTKFKASPYRVSSSIEYDSKHIKEYIEKTYEEKYQLIVFDLFGINAEYSHIRYDNTIENNKIVHPGYFDRYFDLKLHVTDIPQSFFQEYIYGKSPKERLLTSISDDALFTATSWLVSKSRNANLSCKKKMLEGSLLHLVQCKYERSFWTDTRVRTIIRFSSDLVKLIYNQDVSFKLLKKFISSQTPVTSTSLVYLITTIYEVKLIYLAGEMYSSHFWYFLFHPESEKNSELLNWIDENFKSINLTCFSSYEISRENPNLSDIGLLFPVCQNLIPKIYDKKIEEIIKDDITLVNLVMFCISKRSSSNGIESGNCLQKDELLRGLEIDEIYSRFTKMDKSLLTKEQNNTINFYQHVYKLEFPENTYFDFETLKKI